MEVTAANGGIARRLQSVRLMAAVAEFGSLADYGASMRNLIFCLILLCIVGCASNRYYVREDGRQTVILDEPGLLDSEHVAYVTNYEELRAQLNKRNLYYVGTKDGYHIVRWWEKSYPGPSAVYIFAVPKDQFAPAQPFKFDGFPNNLMSKPLFE